MNLVRFARSSALIFLILLATAGCGNAKLKALAAKAKAAAEKSADDLQKQMTEQVESVGTEIKEQAQLAGKINLTLDSPTLDSPIETKACYARFVSQGTERKTVFELRSYSSPDKEEAPSVFFHAQISASSVATLSGQIVSGRLFVQPSNEGPTWFSAVGSPVELKITAIDDKSLTAEIVSGSLQNTQSDAATDVTGSFDAVRQ